MAYTTGRRRPTAAAILALAIGVPLGGAVLSASPAGAATTTVTNCNDSGAGSLRQAVSGAGSGDTITFALSPACSTITLTSGTIDIPTNMSIVGPGAALLAVSGGGASQIFTIGAGITASVSGLTLEKGSAPFGGAIANTGTLTVADSTLVDNTATSKTGAGAIWNKGTLTVDDSRLLDNTATHGIEVEGGAIITFGTLTINNSTLDDNVADDGGAIEGGGTISVTGTTMAGNNASDNGGGSGGAMSVGGTVSVTDSVLTGNISGDGGGLYNLGTVTVTDSMVSDNHAEAGGGLEDDVGGGLMTIIDSTVSDNDGTEGGGVEVGGAGMTGPGLDIVGSTISGNTAQNGGGIGTSFFATISMTNSTVADNTARDGAGIEIAGSTGAPSSMTLANSTVADNRATLNNGVDDIADIDATLDIKATLVARDSAGPACTGPLTDQGYNIDDDGTCGFAAPSVSHSSTLDSTLGPLATNGGPTQTMALAPGSPAIDIVPGVDCPATDQRGAPRTAPCDSGAYDSDGTLTVTNCHDSGAGSLRSAVAAAGPADDIDFALAPSCPVITLTSGPIVIDQDLTISGPGVAELSVSGGGASGVLTVDPGISATVSGLTVTGGSSEAGGGINNGGTLVLANSMVSGNTAATGAIGDGGGIYNSGTLTVRDSRVFDNETNLGGVGGGIDNVIGATLTVIGSTISDNTSNSHGVEGIGGGIDNSGTMTLDSSTVAGDAEGMFLGVVNSGSATVTNSTLADGFSNLGGTTLIVDSTVDQSSNSSATLDLEASIMVGGCSGSTPVTDFGYNIDDNGTCGFSAPSISDSSTVDGSLGPLAANGGPTETMALTAGSPAIDKVTAGDCPLTDQRGATRTAPCDIGPYDTDGNLVVTSLKPPKGKVGKKITIKGTQLTGATVSFNGTVAVITYDTGTRMITSVPAGATSGPVTVTTATGGTVMVAKVFKVT